MNWRRFLHRERADTEQREELEFYLDVTTDEHIARGMEPAAARDAARRKLCLIRSGSSELRPLDVHSRRRATTRPWPTRT